MPVNTFNIVDKKGQFGIYLETDKSKYKSLENVMRATVQHYINQNRVDQIEELLVSLMFMVTSHKYPSPNKPPYFSLTAYIQEKKKQKAQAQSHDQ